MQGAELDHEKETEYAENSCECDTEWDCRFSPGIAKFKPNSMGFLGEPEVSKTLCH